MAFRHGERRLELLHFEENTTISIPLPRDRLISRLNLEFLFSLVITGGSGAGDPVEDAILRLVPRIEVIGDGLTVLYRMDARGAYYKGNFESGCPQYILNPTDDAAATYACGFNIDIFFTNNLGIRPVDTLLNAPAFRTLELSITWGEIDDMFVNEDYTGAAISTAYGCRPIIYETTKPAPIFMRLQDYIEKEVTATTAEFYIDLPVGRRIYQAIMLRTLDAGCKESDIILFTDIVTGEKFYHYQHIPFVQKQRANEKDFGLEAVIAGHNYFNLLEDAVYRPAEKGHVPSGLHVGDVNTAKILMDVVVGAGTTLIRAYTDVLTQL